MEQLISKVQLNSFAADTSDYTIKRTVYGKIKPDLDILNIILELVGIEWAELAQLHRLRKYYLRLSAGEEEKDVGPPPL